MTIIQDKQGDVDRIYRYYPLTFPCWGVELLRLDW